MLHEKKLKSNDWIIILDHSIQIGNEKIFLVYGIREKELLEIKGSIKLKDLTPLRIEIQAKSNGEIISELLNEIKNEVGEILYAVGDYGSDIKKGLELSEIPHIHDITHRIALIIKKMYKNDNNYVEFSKKMSQLRISLSQTKYAEIIPPKQKTKARFLNIGIMSDWGNNILEYIHRTPDDEIIVEKIKWVLDYEVFLKELNEINIIIKAIEKIVKNNGLSKKTIKLCIAQFKGKITKKINEFKVNMKKYFEEFMPIVKKFKKILCSSDIIESAFGKYKNYVSNNPLAGVTGLVLSLSAFTSNLTFDEIEEALENTTIGKIKKWASEEIGQSVFQRRKVIFHSNKNGGNKK